MSPPAATQAAALLWTQPTPSFPANLSFRSSVEITRTLWWQTRFTRGRVREGKSGHNSVTVQNRTHVNMNFFDHKDLGLRFLLLCPKVVKHPVYFCKSEQLSNCSLLKKGSFLPSHLLSQTCRWSMVLGFNMFGFSFSHSIMLKHNGVPM
jgi:hypothetical protein